MKKITSTKILKKAFSAVLAASITLGSALIAIPALEVHAAEEHYAPKVTQTQGVDMAMGLAGLRDPVRHTNSSGNSYVPSDYIYLGDNNRGAMLWRVLSCDTDNLGNEGAAFVMSEYLENASLSGKNYDEAYLSYFTEEEKNILVPYGSTVSENASAFGKNWTASAPSGLLFAPSASDVSKYVANYSGAPALRAYTDASRATAGSWWLRSEADGGVGYVSAAGEVYSETNLNLVSNYNRIAANLDLSSVVFSTRVDGGWRLALLDKDYNVPANQYDFAAWITDTNGNDITISYVNAKPKDVSDDIRELISAIITDADGNVKHYAQLGEVDYTEEKRWPGWWDKDGDGSFELLSPAALYPYHGKVHMDISGDVYDQMAGDRIYVFWEKAYSSRDIDADPNLAYQTTKTSKLVEVCWHESDPENPATCTRFDTCKKCGTQFGGHNYTDIDAHVDDEGKSGIVWEQKLGQYRGEDGFFKDAWIHMGYCKLCKNYIPMDENGYQGDFEPCYCESAEVIDCTHGAICDACGGYFVDPTMHSYDQNGICNRYTHFKEPELNEQNVYEIKNVGNLIWYAQYVNSQERNAQVHDAKLMRDIDFAILQNYNSDNLKGFNWTPMGVGDYSFNAVFDGNGYEIRNLRCVSDQYRALGFIGWAQGTTGNYPEIRNLGLVNCYFENTNDDQAATAALAAYATYDLTVENCYVKNTTVKGDKMVGGLIGYTSDGENVKYCYAVDLTLVENGETVKGWIIRDGSGNPLCCYAYGENAGVLGKDGTGLHKGTFIQYGYNCYYLNANGTMYQDNSRKTEEHFKSGLVAFYLGDRYGQKLGEEDSPVLGGETVYRIEICGGEGLNKYTYSNENVTSHVWDGEYTCGAAKKCINCGESFGEVLEHSYSNIKGNDSFIWSDDGSYSSCSVQTFCEHCGEKNPELLKATVSVNFNGGVRADYVASVFIDETKYSSDVVRIPIITIDEATGIYPSSQIFAGREYYAADLVTNTKMLAGEFEAYFLLDGEMVGEYARYAGVYDLHIVGKGRYEYQEYTYENFFTIEKVEVEMTVSVKDKIVDGTQDYEIVLTFSNGIDYSEILSVYADQYELPSYEVGEYEITGIDFYFYDENDSDSIILKHNETAKARILPRNYVEIVNESYKLNYEYGMTVPAPRASDFKVDEGSELSFMWFKDGALLKETPQGTGTYVLRVIASATDEYISNFIEYTVTVEPKLIEIVVDPYGECEVEIEELGEDWEGNKLERKWYIVEMGKTVPLYVKGLPGTDGLVSVDDERFTSTGFYLYWSIYLGDAGVEDDEGEDYDKLFPKVPNTAGYRLYAYTHSENSFGVDSDIGFAENYGVEINCKVISPKGEVTPVGDVYEYDGNSKEIELAVSIPKWNIAFEDFGGYHENPTIEYFTNIRCIGSVSGEYTDWFGTEIKYLDTGDPVQVFTVSESCEIYMDVTAKYTIYTSDAPIEGSKEVLRVKLTVTVTDSEGNVVNEIKEVGNYTVNVKTETCDASGNVYGDPSSNSASYRVKNKTREVYMLVKEMEVNLDGSLPEYDEKDIVFLTGYTLAPGHRIVDLTYHVQLGGYVGAYNMGVATVRDWVIVDEQGNDVSDEYVIYSKMYEWNAKYREIYRKDFENTKNHTVVHAYSNACDPTCIIDGCTKTREVEPHKGGRATCTDKAICEVCGVEYGGYDFTNHSGTKTVYVRNPDDYRYHDIAYACCGTVIDTEEHTVIKSATCTTLAECAKCGVIEGSYDPNTHSSEDMYYDINKKDATLHDYLHKCCNAVASSGKHEGGEATCTALAICDICKLGYGHLNAENHSSNEFKYTAIDSSTTRHDVSHACCGAYVGTEAHSGGTATCNGKAKCEKCSAEYGDIDPSNHAGYDLIYSPATVGNKHYVYLKCCGESLGTQEHSGGTATCDSPAKCQHCGAEHGEKDPNTHASGDYIYRVCDDDSAKHEKIAPCCDVVVAVEEHTGGEATCQSKAKCQHCDTEYGELAAHTSKDPCSSVCDVCGASKLPKHVNADNNKTCDLCGEKIVGEGGGCGSTIGAGTVVVTLSAVIMGIVTTKKKKEDE